MRSTPIAEMQNIQGMQSLKERRDTKIIIHGEKFLSHHCHPMKERFQNLSQGRLKRSSFIHQAKRLRRQVSDLPEVTIPLISEPVHTPWEKQTYLQVTIQTTITGVYGDEQQNDLQKRVAALSFLDEAYPNDLWTRVYTDGSAQNAVRNGGSGVYVEYPDGTTDTTSIPTGNYCNNYESEVKAICAAAEKLLTSDRTSHPIVILTDARSVLEALQSNKLPELKEVLSIVQNKCRIILQWIPSHCGIAGNERADQLAKEGSNMQQPDVPISYHQKKSMIKAQRKPNLPSRDDYHLLNRQEQVIIFRLRTGHNRLNSHMYTKFKIGTTAKCTCGQANQTSEHILQECANYDTLRRTYWPSDTPMNVKLYGTKQEMENTVQFIKETTLQI